MVLFLAVLALVAFGAVNTSKETEKETVTMEVKGRKPARIRTRRGINLMMNEQYKESLEELNRAMRADSEFAEGYLARSVTQLALGTIVAPLDAAPRIELAYGLQTGLMLTV